MKKEAKEEETSVSPIWGHKPENADSFQKLGKPGVAVGRAEEGALLNCFINIVQRALRVKC